MADRSLAETERKLRVEVDRARRSLLIELRQLSPGLAPAFDHWLRRRVPAQGRAAYFVHADAYPVFYLPMWFAAAQRLTLQARLLRAATYSNVAASYWIRLVDDIMDDPASGERRLLPATAPLQVEILRPYEELFAEDPRAVESLRRLWTRQAAHTYADAALTHVDQELFETVVCSKFSGAAMPLWAVARATHREDSLPIWQRFLHAYAAWHQMLNDTLDWADDLACGVRTYFLSMSPGGSSPSRIARWALREGFGRASQLIEQLWNRAEAAAAAIGLSQIDQFMKRREVRWRRQLARLCAASTSYRQLERKFAMGS